MEAILKLDTALFHVINGRLTAPFLDVFMPFITEKSNFVFIILLGIVFVLLKGRRRDIRGLVLVIMVVLVGDLLGATLKNVFMRARPCHALEDVRLLVGCGGAYAFPSNHAVNIFSACVFLSTRYSRYTPVFLAIAVSVAYSRVYVGVHYPLDVLAGAVLGTLCAFVFSEADKRYFQAAINYARKKQEDIEV